MEKKLFNTGDIIYQQGDVADYAYHIISGSIELIESIRGSDTQIRVLNTGQTFGDLAIYDPQVLRPFTARVLEPAEMYYLEEAEFQKLLTQCPTELLPFLAPAFEKMKGTKYKERTKSVAILDDITKIVITPVSEKLKAQFEEMEIPLSRMPFRIGGYPEGGEVNRQDRLHLAIASQAAPLRVSRQHCEISIENKDLILTDLASRFCTKINGNVIGRGHGTYAITLNKGDNTVVLNPSEKDYIMTIRCE